MSDSEERGAPLVSTLAGDPEMADLLEMFVAELPDRVRALQAALAASDMTTLQRLAHQLKGAAGGYGFPTITDAARTLEMSVKAQRSVEELRRDTAVLADLCQRARSAVTGDK
ncbi:MAG: Hpt domain-containing protein [Phycisphaerae bacterium]